MLRTTLLGNLELEFFYLFTTRPSRQIRSLKTTHSPPLAPTGAPGLSINDFIDPEKFTIQYSTLDDGIQLRRDARPGAVMIKRDLKDAFRHILVFPFDFPLLGFTWRNTPYVERRLPFGLRSSPKIFNLFTESFHCVLAAKFAWKLLHYLDAFLLVFPGNPSQSVIRQAEILFDSTAAQLGLTVKTQKTQTGSHAGSISRDLS